MTPFDNPVVTPATTMNDETGYWLGPSGQGIEDAIQMSPEHLHELFSRVQDGRLEAVEQRYVQAVQQPLIIYRSMSKR